MIYFKRINYICAIIVMILIGLILDIFVLVEKNFIVITIKNVDYIYTALITLGALSATVLTIITSVLNSSVLCYRIKEILNFKNSNLRISELIPIIILIAVLATVSHQLELINLTVSFFLLTAYTIIIYVYYIWEISTNDKLIHDVVIQEINSKLSNSNLTLNLLLDRVFTHYEHSIVSNSHDEKLMFFILENISKSMHVSKLYDYLIYNFFNMFKAISVNRGIHVGIKTFYPILDSIENNAKNSNAEHTLRTWIKSIFDQYNYCDIAKLHSYKVLDIPNNIRNERNVTKYLKIYLGYQYYRIISKSSYIAMDHKERLTNDFLEIVSNYRRFNDKETLHVYRHLLLSVIKNDIILKNQSDSAINSFAIICTTLSLDAYSLKKELVLTIILIYYLIYFYSKIDKETLSQSDIKHVIGLLSLNSINEKKFPSFVSLIRLCRKDISYQVWDIFSLIFEFEYLEHFRDYQVKTVYWTIEAFIEFAFINSIVLDYNPRLENFIKIDSWNENIDKDISKIRVLYRLFDKNSEKFNYETISKIEEIQMLVYGQLRPLRFDQKVFFDYLNEKIGQVEFLSIDEYKCIETDEINDFINEKLASKPFNLNSTDNQLLRCFYYDIDNEIVPTSFINQTEYFYDYLLSLLMARLRNHLLKNFPIMKLKYDDKNLTRLVNLLNHNNYDSYNFPLLEDIRLFMDISNKKSFSTLSEIISNMEYIQEDDLLLNMFFVSTSFRFKLEVKSFEVNDLSDSDLTNMLKKYEIGSDRYVILESVLNRNNAIVYLKNNNKKINLKFSICDQFNNSDIMIFDILFD